MGWRNLFMFHGRLNRAKYWAWIVVMAVIGTPGQLILWRADHLWQTIAGLLLIAIAGFLNFSVTVRRLHDTDVSGWFSLPYVLGPWALAEYGLEHASLGATGGVLVYLGGSKGTAGPNRFGPDPLDTNSLSSPTGSAQNSANLNETLVDG